MRMSQYPQKQATICFIRLFAEVRIPDQLDGNTIRSRLGSLVLGRGVHRIRLINLRRHLTTILLALQQPSNSINSRRQILIKNRRSHEWSSVLSQSQNSAGARNRDSPFLAGAAASRHSPARAGARVGLAHEAQVGCDVFDVCGVKILAYAAVFAVANAFGAFVAALAGEEGGEAAAVTARSSWRREVESMLA